MKTIVSKTLLAGLLAMSLGTAAQAATLSSTASYTLSNAATAPAGNVDLSGLSSSGTTSALTVGAQTYTVTNHTLNAGIAAQTYKADMVVGAVSGQYAIPEGVSNTSPYLSIYGGGVASFTLNGAKTVSFDWGSIDSYNTVVVTEVGGKTYSIEGNTILKQMGWVNENGSTQTGSHSVYFTFTDTAGIASIALQASSNSFEIAKVSAVPLPGALALFAPALLGLGFRRKAPKA